MQKLVKPGFSLGNYPEKKPIDAPFLKWLSQTIQLPNVLFGARYIQPYRQFIAQIAQAEAALTQLDDVKLNQKVFEHRTQLSIQESNEALTATTFALVKQTATRVLGITPFHTQLMAARIIYDGKLVEMSTGEGKTLTAGIAAASVAMTGVPVHLITSNDYLVERDAHTLTPLYTALGLTVGFVKQGMEVAARKQAYACNITYCTAKELVFDYLRDQITLQQYDSHLHIQAAKLAGKTNNTLLRGLCMAIIDEADSILIDEAKVPLIISKPSQNASMTAFFVQALNVAQTLDYQDDFKLHVPNKSAILTDAGRAKIRAVADLQGAVWNSDIYLEESMCQALAALHFYHHNQQYLITKDGIEIIDEITGRVATGRVWSRGLHQMIELKEGCKLSGELVTMTQMTYQRFFTRYLRLGGMSGTLLEARKELFETYNVQMKQVPLRLPSQRTIFPSQLFETQQDLVQSVIHSINAIHATGRPILIGTDSVVDSEALSEKLHALNLPHQVLNARQNAQEAYVVELAGQVGNITISTNMAGRGTDIPLSPQAKALGGLHVICCQHNASLRIDRQLIGRCARQGNPGSAQHFSALEKMHIYRNCPNWLINLLVTKTGTNQKSTSAKPNWLVNFFIRLPKWIDEYQQREQRLALLNYDKAMANNAPSLGSKK